MTYFLKESYTAEGRTILKQCKERLEILNAQRKTALAVPDKPPFFADFNVKLHVGYKTYFEPYYINGFYFGLENEKMQTQFLPPYSQIFFGEAQRYYNSRKSSTFPDHVSRAYEMHRHYGYNIYLDVQRVMLIDANVRELCKRFIEVCGMQHTYDDMGRIIKTVFKCHEFNSWVDTNDYLTTGAETYKVTEYTNEGNIFECFDSFNFFENFLPPDGKNFNYLEYKTIAEMKDLPEGIAQFYNRAEPLAYRGTPPKTKVGQNDWEYYKPKRNDI